jgi:hypothetical protein
MEATTFASGSRRPSTTGPSHLRLPTGGEDLGASATTGHDGAANSEGGPGPQESRAASQLVAGAYAHVDVSSRTMLHGSSALFARAPRSGRAMELRHPSGMHGILGPQ